MSFTCSSCGTEWAPKVKEGEEPKPVDPDKKPRLPRGWKVLQGKVLCKTCVAGAWNTRTISLPVARIAGVYKPNEDEMTPATQFIKNFIPAWRMATDLSNWAKQELLRHDVRRTPDMTTLPKYQPLYLYGHWNQICPQSIRDAWAGQTTTANAIIKYVEDTWKGHKSFGRFAVLWKGDASAGTARFPQPWPVTAQRCNVENGRIGFRTVTGKDGSTMRIPQVKINLPGGLYVLDLQVSPNLRRMLRDYWQIVDGQAVSLEVRLVAVTRGAPGVPSKITGAKIAISGRFPRTARNDSRERVAVVKTTDEAMFTVDTPDRGTWTLYARHLAGPLSARDRWTRRINETDPQPNAQPEPPMFKREIQQRLAEMASQIRRLRRGQLVDDPATNDLLVLQNEINRYEAWLKRYRIDLKYEKRWPADKRKRFVIEAQNRIAKHNRHIDTKIKQMCAAVIGFVERQECGVLQYDDRVRTLFPTWPWSRMRGRLATLCNERNITFIPVVPEDEATTADEPAVDESSDPSAEPEVE